MNFKDYFDLNPEILYMNSGTLAVCPRTVKQAIRVHRDEYEKNPAQSLFDTWSKLWNVQQDLAQFLNANPQDLMLRTNVTIAMNDFLMGIKLKSGSEILTSDIEYGAIVNICKYRAQRDGLSLREFHLPGRAEEFKNVSEDSLVEMVTKAIGPKTSLLMLSHVSTGSGLKLPINRIAKVCREKNVIFAVDGAHAPGAMKLDFAQMECDFYGSNLHKWMMGPKGTGFGWVNKRVQDKMDLSHAGWTTFEVPAPFVGFGDGNQWTTKWMISSSYDFAPFFAIQNTLKFWRAVGENEIWNEQRRLGKLLVGTMKEKTGWACLSDLPDNLVGPLYAFQLPERLEKMNFGLMDMLRKEHKLQVAVTCIQNRWYIRLAPQCYNSADEISKTADILQSLV